MNINLLEKKMKEKNMSKEEICSICNVNVENYPNSIMQMKIDKFVKLCDILEITPNELLL